MSRKTELLEQFMQVRQMTTFLCRPLKDEDFVAQPIEDVSPPKWHLGHTSWFFEKFILEKFKKDYQPYNDLYNFFFNSYYESAGDRQLRARRGDMTRPTTNEIVVYREYINHEILEFFENEKDQSREILDLLELGIHHEQQHQELLITDIKFILGNNPLYPAYTDFAQSSGPPAPRSASFLEMQAGICRIGYKGGGFSFDNEQKRHQVYLNSFRIMDRTITNGEYLEFIESGGYGEWSFWLSEAWSWINREKIKAPLYWQKQGEDWYYYTMAGFRKLDMAAPVCHISYFEADAFASWKGKRLPTEFEWEAACNEFGSTENANLLDKGLFMPLAAENNSRQFVGDVWEWTGSAYLAYPGYIKPPGAVGEYNGKFMINQMVLRGGSFATPASHIRPTYRNFFQTDKRWQFNGFRLAESI